MFKSIASFQRSISIVKEKVSSEAKGAQALKLLLTVSVRLIDKEQHPSEERNSGKWNLRLLGCENQVPALCKPVDPH